MLEIEGIIEDVIFRNEDNGYTVAKLETSDGPITIVGSIPFINLEERVKLEGELLYHPNYGEQFAFTSMEIVIPTSLKGIEKYLGSGLIPNIGPKTAKRIVEKFGLDTLDILQYNPERLKEIKGIGEKKIEKIIDAYVDQRELRHIMIFLQEYNISVTYAIKIYKKYGNDTIKTIQENPYKLSEDIYGIGFKKADAIAMNMGIKLDNPFRIEAGIRYIIMDFANSGHCYVPKLELIYKAREVLNGNVDLIEDSIRSLAMKGMVAIWKDGDLENIYLRDIYKAENRVANKLMELVAMEIEEVNIDIEEEIENIQVNNKMEFAERQKEAIEESVKNGLTVITGGPGTGKTTIINGIISLCDKLGLKVVLAAPTGRASKRMTETTGIESKTIHRLLEYTFGEEESMAFGKNEEDTLDGDILIVDEASMIDILLMDSLVKAMGPRIRLVLVGDVDQLPSVGPGNVLKDIIESEIVKVVKLNEIFRQSEDSMITLNAHKINQGQMPLLNEKNKDFYFIRENSKEAIVGVINSLVAQRLPEFYGVNRLKDIQVLSPMKRGDTGVDNLNRQLQMVLNPQSKNKEEKAFGEDVFRQGDKVMQIKNNYSTEWKIIQGGIETARGEGVFNGDLGIVNEIDQEDRTMTVVFDDNRQVEYDFTQLDELKLAYAITIHKAQGSEFPVVVMPMTWGPPMLFTRNLLYTGITRGKELVVLVGDEKSLYSMVKNDKIAVRYSALGEKMKKIREIYMEV